MENGGECKDLVALMLLLRHIVVFVNWVGHDLLMNKVSQRAAVPCCPPAWHCFEFSGDTGNTACAYVWRPYPLIFRTPCGA